MVDIDSLPATMQPATHGKCRNYNQAKTDLVKPMGHIAIKQKAFIYSFFYLF